MTLPATTKQDKEEDDDEYERRQDCRDDWMRGCSQDGWRKPEMARWSLPERKCSDRVLRKMQVGVGALALFLALVVYDVADDIYKAPTPVISFLLRFGILSYKYTFIACA